MTYYQQDGRHVIEPVAKIETSHLCLTFQTDQSIRLILAAMQSTHTGAAGVVDEKSRLIGILTEREILRRIFALFSDPTVNPENVAKHVYAMAVRDVMTPQPEVLLDNMDIEDALATMNHLGYRYMPIVSHKNPKHMLGIADERELAHHVTGRLADTRNELALKNTLVDFMLREPYGLGYVARDSH